MKTHCKISDVTAFLRRLEMNNDRTWFKEHKAEYDVIRQAWEADIERLIMLVSEYDEGRGVGGSTSRAACIASTATFASEKTKVPTKTIFQP